MVGRRAHKYAYMSFFQMAPHIVGTTVQKLLYKSNSFRITKAKIHLKNNGSNHLRMNSRKIKRKVMN